MDVLIGTLVTVVAILGAGCGLIALIFARAAARAEGDAAVADRLARYAGSNREV
jgi:hypothetical protein